MAITYTDATYISPTSFSVAGNYTHVFKAGRRVICNDDTEIEGTISANSTYGGGITTVVVTDVTLTASLTGVAVSVVMSGATGNLPKHAHTTVEGEGGQITEASISDLDKYTQAETDALLLTVSGVTDHSALDNLDYASSGHTGFQASGDYVTAATLTTASGDIVSQIPTDYISDAEMTTISGDIVNQIPSDYVSDTEMTTISGDIVAQIPSLTGYATEVWVGTNYIDTSEMTTISGNIVSQIPSLSGYATESYVINADSTLSGILAGALDTHKTSDDHDSRYYTEGEVDILIASASGTTDHSALNNLDYASAGHTGFQPAGDYVTTAVLTTASGDIVSQIPTDFISEAEMTTVSGDIVAQIPSLAGYATEGYVDGAITTLSGYVDSQDAATLSSANAYTDTASGTLDEKLEAHKIADDHTIYARVDGSRDFTGQQTFQDNVIIQGDLVVSGTQIIAEVEEVKIEDHTITLNYGETASGISFPTAGVEIDRGTAENYYFVFDEAEDNFKIGISGSLQPVATREDSPIADGVATWEAAEYRFKTTAISDAFNKPFGTITDTVCEGDDSRLSDSRTPTEHGNEAHSPDFASQADLVTVSGLIPTDYISGAEMTTISGDIVAQIPSLTGYATEVWVGANYIDNNEMTTISGDIVAQIPVDYITSAELATASGDIVSQIPSLAGYATETWVSDNYIDESELTTASGDIVSQIPSLAGYATEAYVTTVSGNIVAQIPTDYVSDSEMTTISGDIVAQIPSLTGYATESWVDTNYIDNSEMTTISGDIVSQIPTDYISDAEMTTISGDIVAQIPSLTGYATEAFVTTVSGDIVAQIPVDYISDAEMTTISGDLQNEIDDKADLVHTHYKIQATNDADVKVSATAVGGVDVISIDTTKSYVYLSDNTIQIQSDTGDYILLDTDSIDVFVGGNQVGTFDSNGFYARYGSYINEFSTDNTLAGGSIRAVPTESAVKYYVDTNFAPIAKGVTNGDSHDHSGGDGAQINHTTLSNIGSNSHSTIDTHLGSTSNPHSVTAAQVGNATAQWNANKAQGATLPTPAAGDDEKFLKYDHDTTSFVFVAGTASGISEIVDDTTPQLGGDLDLNGKNLSLLSTAGGSDQTSCGNIATMTVDSNATGFGAALYMASDGHFDEADATAIGTMPCTAIALETGTGSKKVALPGTFIRDDTWDWTPGGPLFVSETTGALTQTAPTTSQAIAQCVGYAVAADYIYFGQLIWGRVE